MSTRGTTVVNQTSSDTVSDEVIFAVAEAVGRDPTEIEPLYDVLDPDALDTLLRSWTGDAAGSDGRVVFSFEGCEVTVRANGEIEVIPRTSPKEPRVS